MRFLVEEFDNDEVDLDYNDLEIKVIRNYVNPYDYDEDEVTTSYTYTVDKNTVYEIIEDDIIDEIKKKYPDIDWPTEEQRDKYFEDNFDELFDKYGYKVYDEFRDAATELAELHYEPDEYWSEL